MKRTKVFVHWWNGGVAECNFIIGRKRAANWIRRLRKEGIRVIWTIYP